MQEMLNLEDIDYLDVEIDWSLLDNMPTRMDTHFSGLPEPNLTNEQEEEQFQKELESWILETPQTQNDEADLAAAAPTPAVQNSVGSGVGIENQAQTFGPSSDQASNSGPISEEVSNSENLDGLDPLPLLLPNSSAPLLNQTQSPYSSSSSLELNWEGAASFQGQDMTQMGSLHPFPLMPNENLHTRIEDASMSDLHNLGNTLLVPNVTENNNFNGQQSTPYPALFHPNPVEDSMQGIGTGHNSSEQFIRNLRPALVPHQDNITIPDNYTLWDYSRPPQSFVNLPNYVSKASEMQKIFDLQSQNSVQAPVNPTFPSVEAYSHHNPASVTMGANPHAYQQPMLPQQPAVSSAPLMYSNGFQQQANSLFGTTSNFFGSGSSVPPTMYPPLVDNQDSHHHHTQANLDNGLGQQGVTSVQPPWYSALFDNQNNHNHPQTIMANGNVASSVQPSWSEGVPNQMNESNGNMNNSPYLPGQSHMLHQPTAASFSLGSSQALSSGILGPYGEGTSSHVLSSKNDEIAFLLRNATAPASASAEGEQEVAPHSASQRGKKKLPESSEPRIDNDSQTSKEMRKILEMKPKRKGSSSALKVKQPKIKGFSVRELEEQMAKFIREGKYPARIGRPPKRRDAGEPSSVAENRQRDSSGIANAGISISPWWLEAAAYQVPHNGISNFQSEALFFDPRRIPNAVYDPICDKDGDVICDPFIRRLKDVSAEFFAPMMGRQPYGFYNINWIEMM